jgi:tryptophan synthase alpha subunit
VNTNGSFELIGKAREKGLKTEVYIMSYAQKVFHFGPAGFCRAAKKAGASGLIVPDLPFDSPEYEKLSKETKKNSLEIVPVVSPGMEPARLERALEGRRGLVYLTSRKGITGNQMEVSAGLKKLCADTRKIAPGARLAVGFGVSSRRDVSEIIRIADLAVVGSSIIRAVEKGGIKSGLKLIANLMP